MKGYLAEEEDDHEESKSVRARKLPCRCGRGLSVFITIGPAASQTKLTLIHIPTSAYTGSWVAEDEGFFAERGIGVDLTVAQNTGAIVPSLIANSAEIGTLTPIQILQANEQGLDLVIVAGTLVYPAQAGTSGTMVRSDSGLTGPRDLAGRKVAVPDFKSAADVLAKKFAQSGGIDYRVVDWVEIPFPRMADSLKAGLIDAAIMVRPFYNQLLDSKAAHDIGNWNVAPAGTSLVAYGAARAWAIKNGETIKQFRAALDEAAVYIDDSKNRASVQSIIAKYTKLPPAAASTISIPIGLHAELKPESLTFWINAAREQELIKASPDPASLIAP